MATGIRRWIMYRGLFIILLICGLCLVSVASAQEGAQEDEPEAGQDDGDDDVATTGPQPRLFITNTDSNSIPAITLRSYGFTQEGHPLSLADQPLVVSHNGEPVEQVSVTGSAEVGTFTVFLIDATTGVDEQIPAIQQTIEQFGSAAYMKEQVDALAIYRVAAEDAEQALEPTSFYNSVRNFFASPLEAESGPTALIDSTVGLLNNMASISPDPELTPAIVIFSDGTDAVSTQYQPGDVAARAAELGIPVHTVWLENTDFTVGQDAGRDYLADLSNNAYGLAARMDQPETVTAILERIIAFREQSLVRYTVPELSAGTVPVELSLSNEPAAQAQTEVTINAAAPTVTLNVPPDSRSIQLPDLEDPIRIALSADVSWLDETERTLKQARLIVNGQNVYDVPVENLSRFEAEIVNFSYGENQLQLEVTDEQELRAISPVITLSVVEGERQIPDALAAGPALLSILPICIGALVLLALFGLGGLWVYRTDRMPSFRSRRARDREEPDLPAEPAPSAPAAAGAAGMTGMADASSEASTEYAPPSGPAQAFVEVLETETQMPSHIPLRSDETRLGRSPALADVAFEQDITVSRLHATILWDGHSYRLYDDDSTSGTWVNDQEVPDYGTQLFDGDDIFLGKVHLRFRQR